MPFSNAEEEELIRVGPGTPSGEVFRRYWLPVEVSANLGGGRGAFAGSNNPIRVKMLGEELVLFRDATGKPGLLGEHCSHRGTSLYYGRVEDDGLRCLYHGWKYDRDGSCLDTPAEPPDSLFKLTVKQTSYPVVEVGGLIFAYMGPPEKQPSFPRYHQLFREDGVRVTGNGGYVEQCNVFQAMHDNNLDPWHGEILHGWFKGGQPRHAIHHARDGQPATPIKFERTPWGTRMVILQDMEGKTGRYFYHETHTVWPTQRCHFPKAGAIRWAVPVDDYRTRWITVQFFPFKADGSVPEEAIRTQAGMEQGPSTLGAPANLPIDWAQQVGAWWNLGHPWRQGVAWEDEVAQQTQGPAERHYLPDWEKWRLATSDSGLMLNREVWREQVERVKQGLDPIGVNFDADDSLIRTTADWVYDVDLDEGMRLFNMSVGERLDMIATREPQLVGAGS